MTVNVLPKRPKSSSVSTLVRAHLEDPDSSQPKATAARSCAVRVADQTVSPRPVGTTGAGAWVCCACARVTVTV